jgi:integrase/recombinase XerD
MCFSEMHPSHIGEPLFTTEEGNRIKVDRLGKIIRIIGERAGVNGQKNCHRFRHTSAINFLRNGGDVYSLRRILGHTTLKMCLVYLEIAKTDIENAHKHASPVANWGL